MGDAPRAPLDLSAAAAPTPIFTHRRPPRGLKPAVTALAALAMIHFAYAAIMSAHMLVPIKAATGFFPLIGALPFASVHPAHVAHVTPLGLWAEFASWACFAFLFCLLGYCAPRAAILSRGAGRGA